MNDNTVIAPAENQADVEDIPEHLRAELEFVWAEEIDDVLAAALEEAPAARDGVAHLVRAKASPGYARQTDVS